MPEQNVYNSIQIPVSADQVWALVRDFCGTWHPAIATMNSNYDEDGHLVRAFTVHGDDTTYREQLTWFSNSEKSYAYSHIEGIAGVENYEAQLVVAPASSTQCTVTLSARLTASEPRASEIASGTKAIFDDALTAIKTQAEMAFIKPETLIPTVNNTHPLTKIVEGFPPLAVSYYEGPKNTSDTLCLFLHGIGGNRRNWTNQLSAVSPHCRTAALDLRGYGNSALGENQSTIEDYCSDILRVAESFGARRLILCGLSYGAWIATSFAMRHPDCLAALVLSGGCTGMSEAGQEERESFRRSREVPMSEGQTPADFAPGVVSFLAGPDTKDLVKDTLLDSMRIIPSETYTDALRCFTNPTEKFDFSKLGMPILLMTGDSDILAPPPEMLQVARRIHASSPHPDVRYECLPRAGHVCNLEAPKAYNIPLIELIQRLTR